MASYIQNGDARKSKKKKYYIKEKQKVNRRTRISLEFITI